MKNKAIFYFAHGAGADSSSDFMQQMKQLIECEQIEVRLFDFPYMQRRKLTGKKSPPDRMPKLIEHFNNLLAVETSKKIFLGGKSMGGRVASMIADEQKVAGLICMGYPFHPPGKPEKLRTEHLKELQTPSLILQGTRDPFGKPNEVAGYDLSGSIKVEWLEDGDHSFKTLKRSELNTEQTLEIAAQKTRQFILSQLSN